MLGRALTSASRMHNQISMAAEYYVLVVLSEPLKNHQTPFLQPAPSHQNSYHMDATNRQRGGKNAVAGIGKKCGKMRKKCGKCGKKMR